MQDILGMISLNMMKLINFSYIKLTIYDNFFAYILVQNCIV